MTDEKPAVKHYETMNGISIYRIPLEVLETFQLVDHEFHLMDDETSDLVKIADFLRKESGKMDEFIQEVNDKFSLDQRKHLCDMIWKIAEADGYIRVEEKEFLGYMEMKFHLSEE